VRGKGVSWVNGKESKLGEPYPKVRLSQDRLPIKPFPCMKSQMRGRGISYVRGNDVSRCGISPTVMVELMLFRTKSVSK
jgi:hypothetical protein